MSEDDFVDFDLVSSLHGAPSADTFGSGITLEQLQEGTIIETPSIEESEDIKEDDCWWTQDELLQHLKDNSSILADSQPWDEKLLTSETLVENQVFKRVLRPGIGPVLQKKNAILFHCNGYIEGVDEPFDSSVLRGRPLLHRLDREDLLPGLMIGILTMRLHEKSEILIRHDYAFGEIGCPPRIPGEASIIYNVEILKIFDEGSLADYELMTAEELAAVPFSEISAKIDQQRKSGNSYFADKRYKEAAIRYSKAIKFLEKHIFRNSEEENIAKNFLFSLYPNCANALIHMNKLRPAMTYCRKAIKLDDKNIKAHFQLGKAKFNNGELDEAKLCFERAAKISPTEPSIVKYMIKIENRLNIEEMITRNLYTKIGRGLLNGK